MVIVIARLKAQVGKEEEIGKQLRMLCEYVRNEEPGTMSYVCLQARSDVTEFAVYERYLSEEALEKHINSPRVAQVLGRLAPMLDGPPAIEKYDELAGKR